MVYLHCGWPRTGTTSFQHALGISRAELREAGIAYPSEWERGDFRGHHGLAPLLTVGDAGGEALDELDARLGSYDRSVLLSTEAITNYVRPGLPKVGPFIEAVGRGREITYLWTLRRIDEFYTSMYLHKVLLGEARGSPADFFLFRHRIGWIEAFVRGVDELERASADAVYTSYDPGGRHYDVLLRGIGLPEPLRTRITERIRTGRRRSARVTHKTAILLRHLDELSERAGVEITRQRLYRLLRTGKPLFENDSQLEVVDSELRNLVHQQAVDASRKFGFEPYLRFFGADEIQAGEPHPLDPDLITADDLRRLVVSIEEAIATDVPD